MNFKTNISTKNKYFKQTRCVINSVSCKKKKLGGVGPVDNRTSTAEAPPIGKIHPFSKIAVTLEPVI